MLVPGIDGPLHGSPSAPQSDGDDSLFEVCSAALTLLGCPTVAVDNFLSSGAAAPAFEFLEAKPKLANVLKLAVMVAGIRELIASRARRDLEGEDDGDGRREKQQSEDDRGRDGTGQLGVPEQATLWVPRPAQPVRVQDAVPASGSLGT